MGSRTRFFGTVLAMLALNTLVFRPSEPNEPGETEPNQEQIEPTPESSQSQRSSLNPVTYHWSRLSRKVSSLWPSSSSDLHPDREPQ